MSRETN